MDKNEVMGLVETYARNVSRALPLLEVLLFGSWVRGNQRELSDIDVAGRLSRYIDFALNE